MYIEILPTLRNEKHSADLVKKYFAKDDGRFRYSGAYFEHLGGGGDRPEVAYQITADDLLAASMLSVRVISKLLAQIPVNVTLADAGADKLISEGSPGAPCLTCGYRT